MYLIKNQIETQYSGSEIINSFHSTLMFLFKNTVRPFIIFKMNSDFSPDYLIDVNEAFCNKLDYSRSELLAKDPSDLFGDKIEEVRKIDNIGVAHNESVIIRQYLIKKDGQKVPFEICGHFSSIDRSQFGLAMALDISDIVLSTQKSRVLNKYSEKDVTIKNNLKRAIERKEFFLHYQPKIDVATGRISGAEALIRWNRGGKGIIPPTSFIPIAEESKLIIPIGEWVLYNACRQSMEWKSKGLEAIRISVNISAVQLQHKDFFKMTTQVLKDTRINPGFIEFEITESALINNFYSSNEVLNDLREMGIKISLDDFGTGYSSLSYLRNLNIDNLKIDRSFIKDIVKDRKNLAIVKSIIEMAHTLGLEVTAEGIEDLVQYNILRQYKCDYVQGYLFSIPVPAGEFERFASGGC